MSLESADWAVQLSLTNPLGSDPRSQGDDHIRLTKKVMQGELAVNNRQWVYTGDDVTRRSGTAFTLTSDKTSTYENFRRVKVVGTSTGTIYGEVSSSTFSATTAVNLTFDSGSMSNEALTVYVGPLTGTNPSVPTNVKIGSLYLAQTEKIKAADETTNDKGTGAEVLDGSGTFRPVGLNVSIPLDISAGASLTLANVSTEFRAVTTDGDITLDTTTDNAPNGSHWAVANESGGTIQLIDTGVTLSFFDGSSVQTGDRTLANGGYAEFMKRVDGQYRVVGTGIT